MSTSPYAWIIDQDHLSGPGGEFYDPSEPDDNCIGVTGPRDADISDDENVDYESAKAALARNYEHHHQFRMYDDDKILYVTGTLYWNGDPDSPDDDEDDYVYGPLRDYGHGGLGCVLIQYTGRPEWDCG